MKRQYVPVAMLLFLVFVAISAMHAQHYDDLYYNPKTDYAHFYGGKSDKFKSDVDNDLAGQSDQSEREDYDDDDDGYFYSSRIRRFHRPARFHYYEMWSAPWGFYDPWYMGSGMGMFNNFYPGYGMNSWNSWNPYCFGAYCNPWSFNRWNNGYFNTWGMGGNVFINNYYGNGWFGNGWSPYYTGWNNPFYNNFHQGGGNWGGGKPANPKGVVTGPRQTGGISTPTPPKKNQYREAESIKNGRNPRVDAQRAETMKSEQPAQERNIRGRDNKENPVIKDRTNDNVPQAEPQKRQEPRRQQNLTPQSGLPKRDNETRSPDRNSGDHPRRKNTAENDGYRYTPPARSNDYDRQSRQPRYDTRSEPRTFDSGSRMNSSPSRSSSGSGSGSHNASGGRRGRD